MLCYVMLCYVMLCYVCMHACIYIYSVSIYIYIYNLTYYNRILFQLVLYISPLCLPMPMPTPHRTVPGFRRAARAAPTAPCRWSWRWLTLRSAKEAQRLGKQRTRATRARFSEDKKRCFLMIYQL